MMKWVLFLMVFLLPVAMVGNATIINTHGKRQFFLDPIPKVLCDSQDENKQMEFDFEKKHFQARIQILDDPLDAPLPEYIPKFAKKIWVRVEEVIQGRVPEEHFYLHFVGKRMGIEGLPKDSMGNSYYILGVIREKNVWTLPIAMEALLNTAEGSCFRNP